MRRLITSHSTALHGTAATGSTRRSDGRRWCGLAAVVQLFPFDVQGGKQAGTAQPSAAGSLAGASPGGGPSTAGASPAISAMAGYADDVPAVSALDPEVLIARFVLSSSHMCPEP